jgi:hypothetical protein
MMELRPIAKSKDAILASPAITGISFRNDYLTALKTKVTEPQP